MSRRFTRLSLLSVLMLTSEVWAIGLGDISLDSALNEPLRAEIALLSASPDELSNLSVALASPETFERYGIDRPVYLQSIEYHVIAAGAAGSVIQVRSRVPIAEPFLTFLVEATWPGGRLLREYTVLLDPPTYAAPTSQPAPAVAAPRRNTPRDSGEIRRQPAPTQQRPRPAPPPSQTARGSDASTADDRGSDAGYESPPAPTADDSTYATTEGGDLVVRTGDTLWGLAARNRPDSRLTINQTMLAIYEANAAAFGGNINVLKAGARLRIPSADDVFQISRGDALSEVKRQNEAWGGGASYAAREPASRPSLVLVPPDDEPEGGDYSDDVSAYEPPSREQDIEGRIAELEAADVPDQQSLIEVRDNELASLRQELADIRGETDEEPVDDTMADNTQPDVAVPAGSESDDIFVDDVESDESAGAIDSSTVNDSDSAVDTAPPSNVVTTSSSSRDKSFVDTIIDFISQWGIIVGAVLVVIGALIWFMRRGDGDEDDSSDRPWETLDSDETSIGDISATSTMQVPIDDDAIVVVEQDSGIHPVTEDTVEAPAAEIAAGEAEASGAFGSLEDTFSSETAVNLDQTDPIAEADFHMAYGLYDQAADLINGALESDPSDKALMSKLCEIYFVWGNRDAFVDAATRLHLAVDDSDSAEWDKIVIMGQQIAADHDLFAGAEIAGATKAVDLSFDDGSGAAEGALDMDFGAADSGASDDGVDFDFAESASADVADSGLEVTAESPTIESSITDATAEMPALGADSPTIDEPFTVAAGGTAELPSLDDESLEKAIFDSGHDADATAEINLEELDLAVAGISDTEAASLGDLDQTGQEEALSDTGINEALSDLDFAAVTGSIPQIDPAATGAQQTLDPDATGLLEGLDLSDVENAGMDFATDDTGQNPALSAEQGHEATDFAVDDGLLDATGLTQVLGDDMAVELSGDDATMLAPGFDDDDDVADSIPVEAETMLAPLDDDEENFDFAKTEALPAEAFGSDMHLEATAEAPVLAETDVDLDLDLDDLTAALQVSEIGDTIEQARDDETVEQPGPTASDETAEVATMSLAAADMGGDLHEARTMTEVGTKLDLARAYVDMGDPAGARGILEEVLDEGDGPQKQQAQQLLDSLPS